MLSVLTSKSKVGKVRIGVPMHFNLFNEQKQKKKKKKQKKTTIYKYTVRQTHLYAYFNTSILHVHKLYCRL